MAFHRLLEHGELLLECQILKEQLAVDFHNERINEVARRRIDMPVMFHRRPKIVNKYRMMEYSGGTGVSGPNKDGWGLAFYEEGDAPLFRESQPAAKSEWMNFLRNHQHKSKCVISQLGKLLSKVSIFLDHYS